MAKLSDKINDLSIPTESSAPGDYVAASRDVTGTPEDVALDIGQELADKAGLAGGADADFTTMPQVDGVPIVESDSNSNGEWVRFADGHQIVFLRVTNVDVTTQVAGDFYKTTIGSIPLPASFSNTNFVITGNDRGSSGAWVHGRPGGSTSTDSIDVDFSRSNGSSSGRNHNIAVVGEWL
jgi:hypothetical protein